MNDLIKRQDAIDAVRKSYDEILDFSSNGHTIADSVEDIINTVPAIKTFKFVRCKKCVYWDTDWEPTVNFGDEVYHYCVIIDRPVRSKFFCAEGLRISDEPDELINVSSI